MDPDPNKVEPAATDSDDSAALAIEEQHLRIEELKFKIKDLQKPDWMKVSTWTGMVAILVAIMGIIGQGILYQIKSAKAESQLDSMTVRQKTAEIAVKKAYTELKLANDSKKQLERTANEEFQVYQSNITGAKHTLDSIRSIASNLSNCLDNVQRNAINHLVRETKQKLNTVVESSNSSNSNKTANTTTARSDELDTTQHKQANTPHYDPNDPQKGKWGGQTEQNGRKISATVTQISKGLYNVVIRVVSINPKNPLKGTVTFHLHNTFRHPDQVVDVEGEEAVLTLKVYGSFTVGAEADNGNTRLELDLAEIPGVPQEFKNN